MSRTSVPSLLSTAEVAEVLGVTGDCVRDLVARGELPACRIGTGPKPRIRIALDDVGDYLVRSRAVQAERVAGARREARPR